MTRSESKQAMLRELGAVPVVADALDPDQVAHAVGRARPDVIVQLFAGEAGVVMMTEIRGASNAKAKRELEWRPAHPSGRQVRDGMTERERLLDQLRPVSFAIAYPMLGNVSEVVQWAV